MKKYISFLMVKHWFWKSQDSIMQACTLSVNAPAIHRGYKKKQMSVLISELNLSYKILSKTF